MPAFVIIANGPFLVREIITEVIQNNIIIALDGAANKLLGLGIKPHVILGDFDSIQWDVIKTEGVTIVPEPDQNETDLMKAIKYCDKNAAQHITIICAMGGRADHDEGVKHALKTAYRKNRPILLHTDQQTLCWVQDESISLSGMPGDYCGMVASQGSYFSSEGLHYECNQHELSICNRLINTEARFDVTGGAFCIMPPQLAEQRKFMLKNPVDRLALQLRDARCYD